MVFDHFAFACLLLWRRRAPVAPMASDLPFRFGARASGDLKRTRVQKRANKTYSDKSKAQRIMTKLAIYVIHSRVSSDRATNVNQMVTTLKASGKFDDITTEIIAEHEPETLSPDLIKKSTDFSHLPADAPAELALFNSLIQPIHVRHVSNLLKHQEALYRIARKTPSTQEINIIIEDDVVFGDRLSDALGKAAASIAVLESFDIMFLGLPSAQLSGVEPEKSEFGVFTKFYNIAPACESYAVSTSGAKKIADALTPMKFSTNVQLSFIIHSAKLAAYFSRPNVFIDGSKIGVFVSTIEANNNLILSGESQNLKTLVDAGDAEGARKLFDSMRFKSHPDNVRIMAELEHKVGDFAKSKAMYEACFSAFSSNNCVLNNQSAFLRNYIAACADHTF